MEKILKALQVLQLDVMGFDGYTLSSIIRKEHISANLHNDNIGGEIVASLDFVHKDYPERSLEAIRVFSDNVQSILLNN